MAFGKKEEKGLVIEKGTLTEPTEEGKLNGKRRSYDKGYLNDLLEMDLSLDFNAVRIGKPFKVDPAENFGKSSLQYVEFYNDEKEQKLILTQKFRFHNEKENKYYQNTQLYPLIKILAGDGDLEKPYPFYTINIPALMELGNKITNIEVGAIYASIEKDDGDCYDFALPVIESITIDGKTMKFNDDKKEDEGGDKDKS